MARTDEESVMESDPFEDVCNTCDGTGWVVTCFDDICVGLGECIHGDGEEACPECSGGGYVGAH